jgi:hypothetical protein
MNIVNIHRHCIDIHNSTKLDQHISGSWLYKVLASIASFPFDILDSFVYFYY